MSVLSFTRWSGWSLLTGGIIAALCALLTYQASYSPGAEEAVWLNWTGALGGLLIVLGIPALYKMHIHRLKAWGQAGFILLLASLLIKQVFFNILAAVTGNMPTLRLQNVELSSSQNIPTIPLIPFATILFIAVTLLFLIGIVLSGLAIASGGIFSRWTGWSLIIAAVLAICGSSQPILSTATDVLFALTCAYLGYQLSQSPGSAAGGPASLDT